ncbi:hypothetical protein AAEU32_15610 [Pseudoalteromonas sp. SSDWG2]|uniref:hypothetical protein n=1 Tax=Pseudoalteromonas sp. SSDWG2 TaxID=3139391 RepID=UPI003BAA28E1
MIQTFNGAVVNAQPPIATISVNKFCVVFKDRNALKRVSLDSAIETRQFINWLLTM